MGKGRPGLSAESLRCPRSTWNRGVTSVRPPFSLALALSLIEEKQSQYGTRNVEKTSCANKEFEFPALLHFKERHNSSDSGSEVCGQGKDRK